jgi:hypothetical protein
MQMPIFPMISFGKKKGDALPCQKTEINKGNAINPSQVL